jgi:hypothetical protein
VMFTVTEENVLGVSKTITCWTVREEFTEKMKYLCKKIVEKCKILMVKSPSGRIRFMGERSYINRVKEKYSIDEF